MVGLLSAAVNGATRIRLFLRVLSQLRKAERVEDAPIRYSQFAFCRE